MLISVLMNESNQKSPLPSDSAHPDVKDSRHFTIEKGNLPTLIGDSQRVSKTQAVLALALSKYR